MSANETLYALDLFLKVQGELAEKEAAMWKLDGGEESRMFNCRTGHAQAYQDVRNWLRAHPEDEGHAIERDHEQPDAAKPTDLPMP